jgi:hypothetical protein
LLNASSNCAWHGRPQGRERHVSESRWYEQMVDDPFFGRNDLKRQAAHYKRTLPAPGSHACARGQEGCHVLGR